MQHLRTSAVLKRFAAIVPDAPFPKSIKDLSGEQQMRLAQGDPDLAALLSGNATALLEASVLDGTFADSYSAPSADQVNAARVAEILAEGNPYGELGRYGEGGEYIEARPGNLTLALELERLDPARAAALKLQANPPQNVGLTASEAARVNAELVRMRGESMELAGSFGGDY